MTSYTLVTLEIFPYIYYLTSAQPLILSVKNLYSIIPFATAKNLGITLDPSLTFDPYISQCCKA